MTAFEEFRRPQVAVGMTVREMRWARKLTQEDLSGRCGLHATYISDVERGRRNLGWTALANLVTGMESTQEEFGAIYDRVFAEEVAKADAEPDQGEGPDGHRPGRS